MFPHHRRVGVITLLALAVSVGTTSAATPLSAAATAAHLSTAPASLGGVPTKLSVPASDDVFVSQAERAKSFSTATWMSVCGATCGGSPTGQRVALAGFKVSGIPANAGDVKAILELTPSRTTATTLSARKVTGVWTEAATTWNTRPATGPLVASHRGFTAGEPVRLDVSSAIDGDGTYSFALTQPDATTTVLYSSRETGDRGPKLTITYTTGTTPCAALPFDKPSAAALRASAKKAFAFYFPPFPVSIDNKDPAKDQYASWLDPAGSSGLYQDRGGYLRDRPLTRPVRPEAEWRRPDFEYEVRQAIAQGLDGFIYEHHTSSDQRWNQLPKLLAAAQAVDPAFKIILSPDFPATAGASDEKMISDILLAKGHPSLFTLPDGSVLLAPYTIERQPPSWWKKAQVKLAAQGMRTSLMTIFGYWNGTGKTNWDEYVYGHSSWGANRPEVTGAFKRAAKAAHGRGLKYMAPVGFEDTRAKELRFWEARNSSTLRGSWKAAIDGKADMVQLVTWNDYGQSQQAPSKVRGNALADVNAYYTTWFKTGRAPEIVRDALYYFHRGHKANAPYDTGKQTAGKFTIVAGPGAVDEVELLAFVKGPGKLVIKQGSVVKTKRVARAGMVSFKVPLVPGTTPVFELQRGGAVVQTVRSGTPIRASVTYQDMIYHAGGGTACAS
ncbi:Glycosyl hydrolase family 71 [Nonomuraea solani]|uniref:Glycosyl hydrolase family 71 n=1 Tax=Nonomuraea solani TaxID=1144553 RepID=A0A1H5V5N8_9ACTN|nr:endo-1,3-alpha-glucanase family glycosylhydrolase [Nonomuraea solani]SEF82051.1 Glycosyl hydrolase family 71 [Nonomuraea solani]